MLSFAFWSGLALVVYTYLGYPVAVWLLARLMGRPAATGPDLPTVSLLIAAHNEENWIGAKIENSLSLDYPGHKLEVVVLADGCIDRTVDIVKSFADRGVRLIEQNPRAGKVSGLNRGFPACTGEIIVCSDANAMYRPDALRRLVRHFADPKVGMVAGEKRVVGEGGAAEGEGLYWKYEHFLKRMDSLLSSAMGATGEIFAMRKSLWKNVPSDTIIEDFAISMGLVRDGYRVVFDPSAVSEETASTNIEEEFKRKVRIVAGGWQAVVRLWPLLSPTYGLVWFQYVSHRVLRWIAVPLALPAMIALNVALAVSSPFFQVVLAAQAVFYGLAGVGYVLQKRGVKSKAFYLPFYFVYLNVSALCGAWRYFTKTQPVTWEKARRQEVAAG